jgi:hypothetical protein
MGADYLTIVTDTITPEVVGKILRKLMALALKGNLRAIQMILRLVYGTDPVSTRLALAELQEVRAELEQALEEVRSGQLHANGTATAGTGAVGPGWDAVNPPALADLGRDRAQVDSPPSEPAFRH